MNDMHTTSGLTSVREATFDVLRQLGITTVFGNPGSTELGFLTEWPEDFAYILALQEASAVAMADGFARATGNAPLVNLHSAAGLGNALGNVFTAFRNQTPLVVMAGQQTRDLLLRDPYLGAVRATEFPRPYVKWSYEPAQAEDVPAALEHAYHVAMQAPRGPTFVSVPSDDWTAQVSPHRTHRVTQFSGPDPRAIEELVGALLSSTRPAIVVGAEIDGYGANEAARSVAEKLEAPVFEAPVSSAVSFPMDHRLFAGFLSAVPEDLSKSLEGHDAILVLGAPAFTFHVPGNATVLASGVPIYHVTADPASAAVARSTLSVVGSIDLALAAMLERLKVSPPRSAYGRSRVVVKSLAASDPMTAEYVLQVLQKHLPDGCAIVEEAPSHRPAIQRSLPITRSKGYFTMASGGLGYGLPAAVGVAMARPDQHVVAIMGDGSMMYSVQALWTAAQHRLPVTVIVLNNGGYGALRSFARITKSSHLPSLDLPGLDFVDLARGHGVDARRVEGPGDLEAAFQDAVGQKRPMLLDIKVDPDAGAIY